MLYELDQAPGEQRIILQCIRQRQALPPAIANRPEVWPGSHLYWQAWRDLWAARPWDGAPIMWMAIEAWADSFALSEDQRYELHIHVHALDTRYCKWRADKAAKE